MTTTTRRRLITAEGTRPDSFGMAEWALLAYVAVVWGSSFVFIAEALETVSPGLITASRLALGALVLSLVPASRRPVDRSDWPQLVAVAVSWMAVPFMLFPLAQQWITSATAGMLNGAMPIFAALAASVMLRRLPGRAQVTGLIVGFAGVTFISLSSGSQGGSSTLGVMLVLAAIVCYGFAINLAVPLQQRYGSLPVLWRALIVASVLTAPFGIAGGTSAALSMSSLISVLVLGILGTGLAFVAATTLAGRTGGTRASTPTYFIPVVALLLGVGFRGDHVEWIAVVGIGLVLVGAALVTRREGAVRR